MLSKEISDLKTEIFSLTARYNSEKEDHKKEIDALNKTIEEVRQSLESEKTAHYETRRQWDVSLKEKDKIISDITSRAESEKSELIRRYEGMLAEQRATSEKALSEARSNFASQLSQLEREYEKKINELHSRMASQEKDFVSKQAQLESANQAKIEEVIRAYEGKLKELASAQQEKIVLISREYEEKLKNAREEILSARMETKDVFSKLASAEVELRNLRDEIRDYQMENVKLKEDLRNTLERITALESEKATLKASLETVESARKLEEIEIRRAVEETARQEMEEIRKEAEESRKHYEDMLNRWYDERDRLKEEIRHRENEIEKMKIERAQRELEIRQEMEEKYKALIENLKREKFNLQTTLNEELSDIKSEMDRSLKIARDELADKEKELSSEMARSRRLENTITELENNIARLNVTSREQIEKLEREKFNLENQIRELRSEIDSLKSKISVNTTIVPISNEGETDSGSIPATDEIIRKASLLEEVVNRYKTLEKNFAVKEKEIEVLKKLLAERSLSPSSADLHTTVDNIPASATDNDNKKQPQDEKKGKRNSLTAIWEDLNKPLIEIGSKNHIDRSKN